jgi:hypothetical protein
VIGLPVWLVVAALQVTGPPPPFRSIDNGTMSQVSTPRQVTVRDGAAWAALWRAHSFGPRPEVDFSREMVVGVFLGTRPTAGYAVEIVGVRAKGENLTVEYHEAVPDRDAITAQMLVSPYHLIAVPIRSGPVTFDRK